MLRWVSPSTIHATVSLGTLRLVSKTMAQQVPPTLRMVIPYLEISIQQGYLVDRIKGLIALIFFASEARIVCWQGRLLIANSTQNVIKMYLALSPPPLPS